MPIKNMGTATMRFKEGIICSGSAGESALNVYGNSNGTYVAIIDNDENTNGHVLKLLTDGNGSGSRILEMEDGDGEIVFRARADGRFGFGPDGVSSMGAGTFVVGIDNSSHTSDIAISKRLQHLGDSNTYMDFPSDDKISLTAGGYVGLVLDESTSGVDRIYLGGPDDDTASAKKYAQILIMSGGSGASVNEANYADTNFFVSGSVDSKDSGIKGTSVFGGDLQVSGTLYAGAFASDVNVKGSTSTIVAKGIIVGSNTDASIERSSVSVRAHGSGNRDVKGVMRAFAGSSPSLTLGTETNVELKIQQNNNSKIVLDTNGRIGINKATPTGDIHLGSVTTFDDDIYALQDLNVSGALGLSSLALNTNFSITAGNIYAQKTGAQPGIVFIHSASALTGNTDYTQTQTIFGELSFAGSNDTANNFAIGASISAITEGTWNIGSDRPTALTFKTTKDGTAVNSETMRLDNAGNLGIGTQDPAFNLHVEATGSGAQPRIGIINRSNSIAADDQVGSLIFGAVENSDFDSANRIVAQIDAVAEQNYDVAGDDGSLNFETSLVFKTVGTSDGLTNAIAITGDNELQVDTITSLDSDIQTEKIQWRNDTVNMAVGDPAVYNQRVEVSGSIKYVEFVKSNVFIDGQERDIQAQPNRVHFNPDDDTNFELRVGGNNSLGSDQYFFVSGSINSKNTATKGTSVFGGDLVTSGAMYFEELSTTPGTIADGTVALYGKDDSGVTKLYLKNESGETEVGAGGGTTNKTVVYGSITLSKNGSRTVSFDRQTSIGGTAYANVKGMLFAPYNGTVSKIMVMLKSAVSTSTHGTITTKIFKNADAYGSAAFSEDKVGDNFSQVNAANPTISRGTFSPNASFNEGDLLQFTIGRDNNGSASNSEGIITIVLSES